MISSDYNWSNLHIVLLTEWYQSVVMTITSRWQLRPYLWTVSNSANVSMAGFYGYSYACFILIIILTTFLYWQLIKWYESYTNQLWLSRILYNLVRHWLHLWNSHVKIWSDFMAIGKIEHSYPVPIAFFSIWSNLKDNFNWIISNSFWIWFYFIIRGPVCYFWLATESDDSVAKSVKSFFYCFSNKTSLWIIANCFTKSRKISQNLLN